MYYKKQTMCHTKVLSLFSVVFKQFLEIQMYCDIDVNNITKYSPQISFTVMQYLDKSTRSVVPSNAAYVPNALTTNVHTLALS